MRGKHLNSGIRGGLWDDEHFQRMGPAVWLFGWLVHRQTRERHGVGLVLGGSLLTYEIISQDTGIASRTLKRWMARLVRCGYVSVTHGAHKRMILQISKAKKFGPQQLRFPQDKPTFPQTCFFAPKSKGPLWAPETSSKGPTMAQGAFAQSAQLTETSGTCDPGARRNRENKPDRKETESHAALNSTNGWQAQPSTNRLPPPRCHEAPPVGASQRSGNQPSMRARPVPYGADRKFLRELEILAELRVGAGPEVHRE